MRNTDGVTPKKKGKASCTPKKLLTPKSSRLPAHSPAGPYAVRTTNFVHVASVQLSKANLMKTNFSLDKVRQHFDSLYEMLTGLVYVELFSCVFGTFSMLLCCWVIGLSVRSVCSYNTERLWDAVTTNHNKAAVRPWSVSLRVSQSWHHDLHVSRICIFANLTAFGSILLLSRRSPVIPRQIHEIPLLRNHKNSTFLVTKWTHSRSKSAKTCCVGLRPRSHWGASDPTGELSTPFQTPIFLGRPILFPSAPSGHSSHPTSIHSSFGT